MLVIFHGYVKLPEGILNNVRMLDVLIVVIMVYLEPSLIVYVEYSIGVTCGLIAGRMPAVFSPCRLAVSRIARSSSTSPDRKTTLREKGTTPSRCSWPCRCRCSSSVPSASESRCLAAWGSPATEVGSIENCG